MKDLYSPNDIIASGLCIGCGACIGRENAGEGKMQFDEYGELKPYGASSWLYRPSASFSAICPFSPVSMKEDAVSVNAISETRQSDPFIGRFQSAYVGHVSEADYRMEGSSGGMVSWVAAELLKRKLVTGVAHVVAAIKPAEENGFFHYRMSTTIDEVRQGARSRYYPVEMSGILKMIYSTPGKYAITGVPCFIKAINLLRQQDPILNERIAFTLGLFCGHMKSARFIESFAWQLQVPVEDVIKVEYRKKDTERPANIYTVQLFLKDGGVVEKDWWHLADGDWGAGFFMNNACNYCDDVVAETADISFGDAWVEPYSSDGRGTNVVVVRSGVLETIIREAIAEQRLKLSEVDANFIRQTQAAGFRQRREGLAYRLTWQKSGTKPVKRVAPSAQLKTQRKLIYRMRYHISQWSRRMFAIAKKRNTPQLYLGWARLIASIYHGLAYHKGKLSEMKNRFKTFQR